MKKILLMILFASLSVCYGADFNGDKYVNVKLMTDVSKIEPSSTFWVIVEITPQKDWHTYWVNPGDAGLATSIDWKLPEGFTAEEPLWQYPERVKFEEFANFGFGKIHYLLVRIKPPPKLSDKEYEIKANVNFLVCKEKCIPGSKELKLSVGTLKNSDIIEKAKLESIRNKIPTGDHKFNIIAKLEGENVKLRILKAFNMNDNLQKIEFFPLEEGYFQNASDGNFKIVDNVYELTIPLDKMRIKTPDSIKAVLVGDKSFFKGYPKNSIEINIPIN